MTEDQQQHSTPEDCIEKLDLIELNIRELVSTINSGQFADVRQRIALLQSTSSAFKSEVQKLPDIERSVSEQNEDIALLKKQIFTQLGGVQAANVSTQLLLKQQFKKGKMSSEDAQPLLNDQDMKCVHCDSQILGKGIGKMVNNLSFDVPLPVQKKEFSVAETEKLSVFCSVEKVHEFDNVGVTRGHQGIVYLTCADCEMGPIGLQDTESGKYLVAVERVKLV